MIGSRLRELRKSKKLTQAKLASLLNVDITLIGKWELYDVTPNPATLTQLAVMLESTTDYLLGNSDVPNIEKTPSGNSEGDNKKWIKRLRRAGFTDEQLDKLSDKQWESVRSVIENFSDD